MSDGLWFPEKGELIGYRLGSDNGEKQQLGVVHKYEMREPVGSLEDNKHYTRVFIHFVELKTGCNNCRLLCDIEKPQT